MLSKDEWVNKLGLIPHPEGGFYREIFRSKNIITIPGNPDKPHSMATQIYFLLGSEITGQFSAWHRLKNLEEMWHFHSGSDFTIYFIDQEGNLTQEKLGYGKDAALHVHVPANIWFSSVSNGAEKDNYSLASCSVFPGFDFEDFELADRTILTAKFPQHKAIISRFTRNN